MNFNILFLTKAIGIGGRERQLFTLLRSLNTYYPKIKLYLAIFDRLEINTFGVIPANVQLDFFEDINPTNLLHFNKFKKKIKMHIFNFIYAVDEYVVPLGLYLVQGTDCKLINGSLRHGSVNYLHKRQLLRNIFYRFSKYIIANSYHGYVANHLNVTKNRFVLYNGLDDIFFNDARENSHRKSDFKVNLLSVSRLHPVKDYITVFKALQLLIENNITNFQYVIVGSGPEKECLQNYINTNKLEEFIFLVGSSENVIEYLRKADIFIHSSKSEGCPNVVLEAMASGLPVIATNTGGTPEIVKTDIGYLFDYKDHKTLSLLINRLIEIPNLRKQLGVKGRQYASSNHSLESLANNFIKILKQIEK